MNGGSLSSDYVMDLLQVPCDSQFPLTEKVNFNVKDITNNYGAVYKATGGGQTGGEVMEKVEGFLEKVVDNRILDLYLKYLGITLLSPATLVPIALIMGKQTFEEVVKNIRKNDALIQQGGEGILDIRVPIVDDKIVGTGLKLAGITALTISPYTLVPLGVLMYIYEEFLKEKKLPNLVGGRKQKGSGIATVLPPEYFGRRSCSGGSHINNNLDNPQSRSEVFSNHPNTPSLNDIVRPFVGGRKRKYIKNGGFNWHAGNCNQSNLNRADVGNIFENHATEPVSNDIVRPYAGGSKRRNIKKGGTRSIFGNDVPPNAVQQATALATGQDIGFPRGNDYLNNHMQLSGNIPSQLHYQAPYHQQLETVVAPPNPNACAVTGSCSGVPMGMAGGAGSDWVGTLYSAGPSNNSDMSQQQFQMFNKSQHVPSMNSHTGGLNERVTNYYNYNNYRNTIEYTPLYAESSCSK